jgi:hypothetical protein
MLRLLLPQIVTLITIFIILWTLAVITRRNIQVKYKSIVFKCAGWITAAFLFFFALYVFSVASVNETPRSVIDRSYEKEMQKGLEERNNEILNNSNDTTKPKN